MALCVPPSVRTAMAVKALEAGRDVLLEKPPAATLGEVERDGRRRRAANGRVLFATWHSRFAPAVPAAKAWLAGQADRAGVDRLEGGRAALAPGAGVDLAAVRVRGVRPRHQRAVDPDRDPARAPSSSTAATLSFPENCATPIAAEVAMTGAEGYPVDGRTSTGGRRGRRPGTSPSRPTAARWRSARAGRRSRIDGAEVGRGRRSGSIPRSTAASPRSSRARESDVDAAPLRIVADAFLLGARETIDAFSRLTAATAKEREMTTRRYTGIWPVAPTPFTDDGAVDVEGMKRVIDCMVDQGVDGICILANFSEQFLLSDEERATLTRLEPRACAGRVPIVVTVSHFATAGGRGPRPRGGGDGRGDADDDAALPRGASSAPTRRAIFEHFERAGRAGGIPIMVQDAPMAGTTLSVAVPRADGARDRGGEALQDRDPAGGGQAPGADRGRRRRHRGAVRRRGGDHADGRPRRRRHRRDDLGDAARPDRAGGARLPRRRPGRGRRRSTSACCRSSTSRTASAAGARARW